MKTAHTAGPWRWEINQKSKSLHLVGGRPRFDLTLMDFERWGMGGATVRFRDTAFDGMNLMHKLHDRPDWIQSFEGRDHHADWCANVIHPDARLIAAAPDLLEALKLVMSASGEQLTSAFEAAQDAITKATGATA